MVVMQGTTVKEARQLLLPCALAMTYHAKWELLMQEHFYDAVIAARDSVRSTSSATPSLGVILGSGLSEAAESFSGDIIPYRQIVGLPQPRVLGHSGTLTLGTDTAIMAGRSHLYEGHALDTLVLPVFLLHALGVRTIILTNAAGAINTAYTPGSIVLISDHLNLTGVNPLTGPNDERLGPRFPDMTEVYDTGLRALARRVYSEVAGEEPGGGRLAEGVYAALPGPNYETPAEIRMLAGMGADLVGMSTVPEAIAARYLGMRVLGLSSVTNAAAGLGTGTLDHAEVVEVGRSIRTRLIALISGISAALKQSA